MLSLRRTAETRSDTIIEALKSSMLNYEMYETPYSVRISFRKRFISDRPPLSPTPTSTRASTPPPWSATTTTTRCAGCDETRSRINKLEESNSALYSSNLQVEQKFQSLLAQNDALRRDLENERIQKNQSDGSLGEARDKILGLLDEVAALKNDTINLKIESDILAKEAADKVGDLLKKNDDLLKEVRETHNNEEKSKTRVETLTKERNDLKKEVTDKIEQLKKKNKKLNEMTYAH